MQFTAICLLTDAMQFTAKWLLNLRLNKTNQILAVHMMQTNLRCRSAGPKVMIVEVNQKSLPEPTQVNRRKSKVSRMTREFSQAVRQPAKNCHALVPGMSQYGDSQDIFMFSVEHVGNEDSSIADTVPATISQRTEFFELSPK